MSCGPLIVFQETGIHSKVRDSCHVSTFSGQGVTINVKSFKPMQYNLQAKAFGFHGCLTSKILNIFCIVPYARIIMAILEQLMGSIGPYTILSFALRNVKLEKNYLSQRIILVVVL